MRISRCPAFALLLLGASLPPVAVFAQQPDPAIANLTARPSPKWLTSGVIYELYTRSFSPEGTLNGATARLDNLKKLGVNVIWLMPINPNGQLKKKGTLGSPYAVRDYYGIDPAYGTKDDLKRLVAEAHQRGMKVILDVVVNHTAWDSVLMAHPDFYKHDKNGQIISPYDWSDVAALDYSNPKLRQYISDMLQYWIKEFDLDGFRCDVAFEVPTDFWETTRGELERIKPDVMMLAEASKPELLRKAFDIDYSWPLLATVNNVIEHGEPATAVQATINQQGALFPKGALHMRVSDDHDEERAIARYGIPGSLAASALMFTLNGVPVLYNGMEVGDVTESTSPALFDPPKVFWQIGEKRPQYQKFYATMIPLRATNPALQQGELIWIHNSDEAHVVSYLRRSGSEEFLVAINLSNTPFRGTVEAAHGVWKEVEFGLFPTAAMALPAISLDAFEFRIFQRQTP
jgi:cyclomaltodextrinase / maltogenic alpha-amylase / neopullulanase